MWNTCIQEFGEIQNDVFTIINICSSDFDHFNTGDFSILAESQIMHFNMMISLSLVRMKTKFTVVSDKTNSNEEIFLDPSQVSGTLVNSNSYT